MLFIGSSFLRHDDVWVWRSNSTHSQAWPDPGDFGLNPRPLYTRGSFPFFIEYEEVCAPEGVLVLTRKILHM